jgi:hypothetical protein
LPLHVLSLSRWPNLGLCSLPEITNLRIERALEGRPRGAAFDIRGEALLACDDVGVLQDSQHSRHHQITRSEAVTVKVRFVAKRLGERGQALLHKLHRLTFSSPVVDVLIIAKAATARGCRTVGVGKSGGARNGGLSGRAAPMDCNFIALGRSRCHSGGAKNNCSGKRYFDEHFRLLRHPI